MSAIPHKYRFRVNGLYCFLKTVWRSLSLDTIESGIITSGHDFYEQPDGTHQCGICGAGSLRDEPGSTVIAEHKH